MNKIFKVIWNHSTQSWVAVSELNRAKGKTKSTSAAKVAAAVAALGLASISGNVFAAKIDNAQNPTGTTQNGNLVIGADTDVFSNTILQGGMPTKDDDTFLVNAGSQWETDKSQVQDQAANPKNTVIGAGAQVKRALSIAQGESVVVGNNAVAKTAQAVVIGAGADSGNIAGGVTIGYQATSDQRWTTVGHTRYDNPHNAQASIKAISNGKETAAIGEGDAKNRVLSSGVAVGRHANSQGGGVALGDKARALTGDEEGNPIVNKLGRGLGVAIGSYALSHSGGLAIGAAVESTGLNSMAFGRQAAAKGGASIAVGSASAAVGKNAISMGHSATSLGERSIAIGASQSQEKYDATNNTVSTGNDSIAMGSKARSIGTESTSIGFNSTANGNNTVAIGSNARVNDNIDLTAEQRNKYYPYYQDWLNWFNEDPSRKDDPANAKNWAWVQSAINGFMHAAENSVAVGNNAQVLAGVATANGGYEGLTTGGATAIGHNAQTAFGASVAVGSARANAVNSIAIGAFGIHKGSGRDFAAETRSDGSLAVGNLAFVNTQSSGGQAIGRGASVLTNSSGAVALGQSAVAQGAGAVAIGGAAVETKEEEDGVLPRGSSAVAGATNSVALSANSKVYQGSDASIAIGYGSAVGEGAVEQDADPNIPPTAVTSTTTAVKAVALGAETKVLGNSSAAVGSTNKVTTENTFVLGSGVNMKADGSAALSGTVANSVYLGADSHAVAGTAVGTKNKTSEDAEGTTTTAGDKGAVASATVGGQTYGGFAGATANGVVSVGAAGSERRIQNVAAGEISSTSTDAINGSQLYAVGDNLNNLARTTATALGTTVNSNGTLVAPTYTVTNNPSGANVSVNNVKDAVENLTTAVSRPLTFAANMGTALERKLGTTLNVKGANSNVDGITRNTDTATSGSYSAKNIQTFVDTDGIQIQMAENPEFTSVIVPTAGANNVIINNNGINAGNKPITNVNNGLGSYTGAPNSTNPKGGLVNLDIPAGAAPTVANSTVATVGDLRNMGWIVESNKTTGTTAGATTDAAYTAQVKNAQQVKFVGTGEATVSGKTENGVNTITVHVAKPAKPETTALQIGTSTNTAGNDGTTQATTEQGKVVTPQGDNANKLVKAGDIANAINQSGFNVKSGGNKAADDQADATLINPGEEVTFTAGKNLTVKRVDNQFTFATDENVTFTNVNTTTLSVGAPNVADKPAVNFTTEKAKPATNNPTNNAPATALNLSTGAGNDSKPVQITGVGSTLNTQAIDTNPDAKGNTPAVPANLVNLTENSVNPNSAATVGDLQNMGWVVSTKGDGYKDVVKNANEVQFVGKNGVSVTGETVGDIRTITVDVNAQNVANNAQLPVVYTKADGTKVALNPADNKFYPAKADGTPDTTQPEVAKADVIASLNNGGNSSTAPTSLANVKGNLAPTYNVGDMEIVNGKPNTTAQTTPTKAATAPTAAEAAKMYNNAATVGDVLNTGWNLQGNGEAVDFVKPYDTVNFVNGTGTTVEVKADADGKVNTIKVNTLTSLVDKDGNPVIQVGDKFYKTEDIDPATGKPLAGKNPIDTAANPINVNMVNPTAPTSSTTTPVQLGNVAAGAGTKDIATKPTGVENTAPTNVKFADLEKAPNTNVLTVADAKNMGWVVSAGNDYSDAVKNTNEVKFVGTGLATVTGVTQNDIRTVAVHVDAQKVAEAAQLPVVYTNAAGDKLIKGKDANDADVFYPADVTLGVDGKPADTADYTKAVQPSDVIASMNSGSNETTPTTLTNVKGNLAPTTSVAGNTLYNPDGTVTNATEPTKSQSAPNNVASLAKNAATVADVLNAGFNLQENGTAKDFVKPYDTVNFANGTGTIANVTSDGNVSTVTFNIDQAPSFTVEETAGNTDAGKVKVPAGSDGKFANATTVADAINKSGFTLKTSADTANGGVKESGSDELINPSDTVEVVAGKNLSVKQEANGKITLKTKDEVTFTNITVPTTGTDNVIINNAGIDAGNKPITNINNGLTTYADSTKPTHGLVDLSVPTTGNPTVANNTAATVGDLRNMGWIVSTPEDGLKDKHFSKAVKNAQNVNFIGTGHINVKGAVATNGDYNVTFSLADAGDILPQLQQNAAGPNAAQNSKTGRLETGSANPGGFVSANTVVNAVNQAGWWVGKNTNTADLTFGSDVNELVNFADAVRFADGKNTVVKLAKKEEADKSTTTTIKVDVDLPIDFKYVDPQGKELAKANNGKYYPKDQVDPKTGALKDPATAQEVPAAQVSKQAQLTNGLNEDETKPTEAYSTKEPAVIEKAIADFKLANPNATEAEIAQAKADAIKANPEAKDEVAPGTGGVNLNNVAWATQPDQAVNKDQLDQTVNKSGFFVKQNGESTVAKNKGEKADEKTEKVTPNDVVDFVNGTNTKVTATTTRNDKGQDVTAVRVDVTGMPVTYTDKAGNKVAQAADGKFYPVDKNTGLPDTTQQAVGSDDIITSMVNPNGSTTTPTTLTNVAAGTNTIGDKLGANGKPLVKIGDKYYNADDVTNGKPKAGAVAVDNGTNVTSPVDKAKAGLADLANSNANNALTVADAKNLGWVVSADGNNYSDDVRNANEVKFVGGTGINVTGETKDGVREINISLQTGNVTGGNSGATGDDGFVTGTKVADAINNSGWNIGKNTDTSGLTFGDTVADSLVNPADSVKFADGKNSEVKFAQTTENGKSVTTVKVNVDVPVDYRYKDSKGNEVVKGDDGKFYAIDPATGLANKASPIDTTTNPVTKDGAKLTNGSDPAVPYKQGNVDSDKENPVAGTGGVTLGNVAWATQPDQAVNKDQLDQTVNKSGWELQNNGEKRDKVQPNDKVNFINGGNTNLVVATAADGKSSTVQVNVTGLPVTYAAKDNTPVTRVGDKFFTVDANGNPTSTEVKAADLAVNVVNPVAKPNEIGVPTKISNVADGDISPTSKDAVNGSQLYNLQKVVGGNTLDNMTTTPVKITENGQEKTVDIVTSNGYTLTTYNVKGQTNYVTNNVIEAIGRMNEEGIKFFHANDANVNKSKIQKKNEVDSSAAGAYAVAVGYQSEANGDESLAIGHNSVAAGKQSIAIGTKNTVTGNHSGAIGDPNTVKGNHSYVYGNNNSVETDNTFVLGNNVTTTAENSVFLGANTGYVGAETHSDGSLNEAKARTTAGKAALTKQVTGGVENHYAGGKKEEVVGVVSVGNVGVDANGNVVQQTRRIQNVAPGLISENSTDAINGSQLYSVTAGFDKKLGDVHNKINRNNKNLRAGIAGANAAAGLPQVYLPGKSMVAASAGTFKGQSAVAVGYSRASDNGKLILKLQGNANTRGDFGGSVGIGYQW